MPTDSPCLALKSISAAWKDAWSRESLLREARGLQQYGTEVCELVDRVEQVLKQDLKKWVQGSTVQSLFCHCSRLSIWAALSLLRHSLLFVNGSYISPLYQLWGWGDQCILLWLEVKHLPFFGVCVWEKPHLKTLADYGEKKSAHVVKTRDNKHDHHQAHNMRVFPICGFPSLTLACLVPAPLIYLLVKFLTRNKSLLHH